MKNAVEDWNCSHFDLGHLESRIPPEYIANPSGVASITLPGIS
jgi:hypothetical protein